MIDFIEKEPFETYDSWNDCKSLLYPNVMVKDGKEYFIKNRRETDYDFDVIRGVSKLIDQLKENNGIYATFYGCNIQITDFLNLIIEHHYSFCKDKVFDENREGNFIDFHGNLNEISSVFMYRMYDSQLIEEIKEIVELINNKEWEKAESKIQIIEECYKQIEQEEGEEMEQ
ncbi:hypothetical protein [uncultured Clostridium sp.]|jgi:hypothetical protein|uniref:hypothetical protein n=1 Tax=uncultured Clostridium sp. TaxID=59620 RepID=UPI00272A85F7|nr:hypothetical protein [uncultured Clostridium sp.]